MPPTSSSTRPLAPSRNFPAKLSEMRLRLSPLVQITTGLTHPFFPKTLLHYWLLTNSQLDELAAFYHQKERSRWTDQYPKVMEWREDMGLEEKRREWGRFMGLRGCERRRGGERENRVDWEELAMREVRRGREEEEALRRKTMGYY